MRLYAQPLTPKHLSMLLEEDPVIVCTTADLDGNPHSLVMCRIEQASPDQLVVVLDYESRSYKNLRQNPRLAIAVLGDTQLLSLKGRAQAFDEKSPDCVHVVVAIDLVGDQLITDGR